MWILFSFLSCIFSAGNTIFNKFSSKNANSYLSATIKAGFMVVFSFAIIAIFGHIQNMVSINMEQLIFIIVTGLLTSINWIAYFAAIKRSNLDVFAPFNETSLLTFSNIFLLIFITSSVVNTGSWVSILLYALGIALLAGVLIYVIFNKKLNSGLSKKWVIFGFISTIAYASCLLLVKLKLGMVVSDVIVFYQICIVFVVSLLATLLSRGYKDIAKIKPFDFLKFAISSLFNAAFVLCRYQAYSYSDCIPSITNIIVSLAFVGVALFGAILLKKKEKRIIIMISLLTLAGMILEFSAGLFI